jgi:hypothetical protein
VRRGADDITDEPIDLPSGKTTDDVEVVLTNAETGLAGAVVMNMGEMTADFTVIVFPADKTLWRFPSRRIRTARPDQNGKFRVTGVPVGDYMAIALADADESIAQHPDQLDRLRSISTPISVADGTVRTVLLKVVTRNIP